MSKEAAKALRRLLRGHDKSVPIEELEEFLQDWT